MTNADALHELSISRLIAASPEQVFHVFTTRITEFWTPPPWVTTRAELDLRPGGVFMAAMRGPDGVENEHAGVFLEVVPDRRLVWTDAFAPGWIPQTAFMLAIVTFEPEGGATRYTARARHWDAEASARHDAMGFKTGWGIVADQLAALAEA